MKLAGGTFVATVVLALAVWILVYIATPDTPLNAAETMVVVGACAAVVLGCKWISARFRKGHPPQ